MGGNPPRPSALNCSGSSDSRWHLSADFQSKCDLYLQEWRHRWMCCPGQHLWSMLMMKNIRKWRQREIMKPVQDYNTASLLQEMCRRRSHVPQKADFSLVKVTNKQQNVS
ncbi:uncharacterized protein LOC144373968 isoform X1 [Ictidomys tridecemlineatus]